MQRVGYKVTLGYVPKRGSQALATKLLFATNNTQKIQDDTFLEQALSEIEFIQSVFIDNSQNAQALSIQFQGGPSQLIIAKANTQGYYPVFLPNGKVSYLAQTTGNVDIPLIFSNVVINALVWPTV